jgi:hypothetical protein
MDIKCVFVLSASFVRNVFCSDKYAARVRLETRDETHLRVHTKRSLFLSDFNLNGTCRQLFFLNSPISNFIKIRPTILELLHAERDRQTCQS